MSVEAIARAEPEEARPALDLSSPLVAIGVGAIVPLLKVLQIARDWLARRTIPDGYWTYIPDLLVLAAAWGAYTPLIFWLGRRFPPSRLRNALVHLGALLALALPLELYWWFFASPEAHRPPPDPFGPYVLFRFANALLPYLVILGAGLLHDRHVEQSRYARVMLRLQRQLADTELAALRLQVDPALLSSTLEAIEEACRKDDDRAERLVVTLADFLRMTLDQIDRRDVRLARELTRLQPFVTLLSELSGRTIRVAVDVNDADARALAAPPTLLPEVRGLLAESSGDTTLHVSLDDETLLIRSDGVAARELPMRLAETAAVPSESEEAMPEARVRFALRWPLGVTALLLVSLFARAVTYFGETGASERFLDFAYWTGIGTILTALGCFFSVWLARRVTGSRRAAIVLLVLFAGTFAAAFACELAFALVHPRWEELNSAKAMVGFLPTVARSRAVAYHHLLFVVLALFAMTVRYDQRALDVLALHARVREAQLRKLRSQLRPHFLFNSLNSILGRLSRDREAACAMASSIRRFLQTTFELEPRGAVPLAQELDAIREYLDIERNRIGERLRVEWHVAADVGDVRVPALLLQPLVENAVQHGVATVSRPVTIRISATRSGRALALAVEDDGAGRDARRGRGVGLATTRGLLAAFYGADAQLTAAPRDPQGFAVRMKMPVTPASSRHF
jgi:LytS/YehU family sensor histidine kinase